MNAIALRPSRCDRVHRAFNLFLFFLTSIPSDATRWDIWCWGETGHNGHLKKDAIAVASIRRIRADRVLANSVSIPSAARTSQIRSHISHHKKGGELTGAIAPHRDENLTYLTL